VANAVSIGGANLIAPNGNSLEREATTCTLINRLARSCRE
jgi:hypothetical protein